MHWVVLTLLDTRRRWQPSLSLRDIPTSTWPILQEKQRTTQGEAALGCHEMDPSGKDRECCPEMRTVPATEPWVESASAVGAPAPPLLAPRCGPRPCPTLILLLGRVPQPTWARLKHSGEESRCPGGGQPGFTAQPCHWPAAWPQASHLTSVLRFLHLCSGDANTGPKHSEEYEL